MDFNIIESIFDFLTEKNIVAIPLVTLIVLLVVIGVISSKEKIYQWIIGKKIAVRVITRNRQDLKEHSLFIKEPKYRLLVQNSKFGTLSKDKIFRFILTARLRSTIDNTRALLENNFEDASPRKLYYYFLENNRCIARDYNKKILKYLESEYGLTTGENIYEYIMNTEPAGFNAIYDSQLLHIDQMAEFLCKKESAIFKNNIDRFEVYLHVLNSLLYLGIVNAENMFKSFNGDLERITFNHEANKKEVSVYNK